MLVVEAEEEDEKRNISYHGKDSARNTICGDRRMRWSMPERSSMSLKIEKVQINENLKLRLIVNMAYAF